MKVFSLIAAAAAQDINQKVYIENSPVVGDGAGVGAVNHCRNLPLMFVDNADDPAIKVCGKKENKRSLGGVQSLFFARPTHSLPSACARFFLLAGPPQFSPGTNQPRQKGDSHFFACIRLLRLSPAEPPNRKMRAVFAAVVGLASASDIPHNEKVEIEGIEIYGQSAGTSADETPCHAFARSLVDDQAKPTVSVTGTGVKVTVYLRGRCEAYHKYTVELGACDSKKGSSAVRTASPATHSWMAHAQSYAIVSC